MDCLYLRINDLNFVFIIPFHISVVVFYIESHLKINVKRCHTCFNLDFLCTLYLCDVFIDRYVCCQRTLLRRRRVCSARARQRRRRSKRAKAKTQSCPCLTARTAALCSTAPRHVPIYFKK